MAASAVDLSKSIYIDRKNIEHALKLAADAIGVSDPNPRVGCVIGFSDGRILAAGSTQQVGGPHAEVVALQNASAAGHSVKGATAWVTLEPCAHHGRTPPCCDALISAGLKRVVIAGIDHHKSINGLGVAKLQAAGLEVSIAPPDLVAKARELNIGFFSRHQRGRPWVRLKVAITLDGKTALSNGVSQWITSPDARLDGHRWRKRSGAILTGIGTVLADDPRLDVRLVPTLTQPLRVVADSHLRTPLDARVLSAPGMTLICGSELHVQRAAPLTQLGAQVEVFRAVDGTVDLAALLHELSLRQVNELHVEAGGKLNAALLRAGLVDEMLIYLAPRLVGPGLDMAALPSLHQLSDALEFEFVDFALVGADLRIVARSPQGIAFVREP